MTMYPAMVNSPVTELAEAIDETQTSINLLSGDALPAAPNLATIGDGETAETVLYNGKSGNTLTEVVRGFQGTARSWGVASPVARLFTAYDHDTVVEHVNSNANPHNVTTEQVNKIAPKLVSDLPSAYPNGISMFNLSSTDAAAWKTATGYVGFARAIVETTKVGGTDYIIVQRVTFDNAGTVVYERSSDANNSWTGSWVKVVSRSEFDDVTAQLAETVQVSNARAFGAKGNGVDDDWQAITNALNSARAIYGGVVYLPPGNYAIGQTLVIPPTVELRGLTRQGVNIKGLPSLTGNLIEASADGQGRVNISNLSLQGHADIGDAIYLNHARGITIIENILFTSFKNGIHSYGDKTIFDDGSWGVQIRNCYFSGMREYAINLKYGSNGCVVQGNQIWNSANGILIQFGRSCTVEENILQENTGVGIRVESSFSTNIENNYFENNGIDVQITKEAGEPAAGYCLKTVISKNFFVAGALSTHSIRTDYAKQTTIDDNWSRNHTTAFVETTANTTETSIARNYSAFETFLIDAGFGTIVKKLNGGFEEVEGNTLFKKILQIDAASGLFKLGQYFPGSPVAGQLAHDPNAKVMSFFDGTAYRKAGTPAGIKQIVSPNTSATVSGTGAPDRFTVQPDTGYGIVLTPDQNVLCWISGKTTSGFTINIAPNGSGSITYPVNVSWQLIRP